MKKCKETVCEWPICPWCRRIGLLMISSGVLLSFAEEAVKTQPELGALYIYMAVIVTGLILTLFGFACKRIWKWWQIRKMKRV